MEWRKDPGRVRRYSLASWIWVGLFSLRLAVQLPLYLADALTALGVARIAMGVPAVRGRDLALLADPAPARGPGLMRRRAGLLALLLLLALGAAPAARADWSGDGNGDVLAVDGDGRLLLYRGTAPAASPRPRPSRSAPAGPRSRGCRPGDFAATATPTCWR